MATDFTYGGKQIVSGGPFKPSGKDMPSDARTRVDCYADIASIPNPYVGLKITVKVDETNNNKMTDYIVKSLKANSIGVANSLIDEVEKYVDYLGISSSGGGTGSSGNVDLTGYATETYVDNAIDVALDGHTFKFLTQAEYDALETKDPLVKYHITDATDNNNIDTSNLASNLSLTGTKLQLKNSKGDLIGSSVTLPKISGSSNSNSGLEFTNENVVNSIHADVDETVIKQEYLGGYIEIQPDEWSGATPSYDATTNTWGFPMSLTESEQKRIRKELLHGNKTNIRYFRFPLGFAYRGYRNIDETTKLAKNIGERWKGQNQALKRWFSEISECGGGLAPEYWCPPPYWVTSGGYYGDNSLSAGGSYAQNVTLSSIKTSDPTQYQNQIEAFSNAVVDDLEYLHTNIAPVRMFGLQNEPGYANMRYGACSYDSQTYNDVLEVLWPKIQSSEILSWYGDEPNEVKLLVASDDDSTPFKAKALKFLQNHADWVWGFTHHSMRKASGEKKVTGVPAGADWFKSSDFKNNVKENYDNVFINEYEYFGTEFDDDFRCSNNMLRMIFESSLSGSKVMHPIIHICKPIGQTLASTNTKGYCMYAVNLKGSYGVNVGASTNDYGLAKGSAMPNTWAYNSWAMFGDNLPVGAYVVGYYTKKADGLGWVVYKYESRYYIFMANNTANDASVTLDFYSDLEFEGKAYSMNYRGDKINNKSGSTIEFVIPPYSGQVWIEKGNHTLITPPDVDTNGSATNGICYYTSSNIDATTGEEITGASDRVSTQFIVIDDTLLTTTIGYQTGLRFYDKDREFIDSKTISSGSKSTKAPDGAKFVRLVIVTPSSTANGKSITVDGTSYTLTPNADAPTLQSISATYTQGSTVVYTDSALDSLKSNLVVKANYSDGTSSVVTSYTLSGTLTTGSSTITVTYGGKTTTFNVTVTVRPTLTSITATYTQGATIVYPSTSLDTLKNNLVVAANYSDNSASTLSSSDYVLSGNLTEGTSTITVTYNSLTTTFNVNVTAQSTLDHITAVYEQGSTNIYSDTDINSLKSNLTVTAHYTNSTTQVVSDYILSGNLTVGTSTITVTYETMTTTFDVIVSEKPSETPDDNGYIAGYINDNNEIGSLSNTYTANAYKPITSRAVVFNSSIAVGSVRVALYDENKNFISRQANTNITENNPPIFLAPENAKYVRVSLTTTATSSELDQLFNEYTVEADMTPIGYELGGIASTGGALSDETDRYRTTDYIPITTSTTISFRIYGATTIFREYNDTDAYIGSTSKTFIGSTTNANYSIKDSTSTKFKLVTKPTGTTMEGVVFRYNGLYYVFRT